MIASDVLLDIAGKLRQSQKLTALDLYRLYQVAQSLAKDLGYEGIKDTAIFFDAAVVLAPETQEKNEP